MKKLNDEQLSRLLSTHASEQLGGPKHSLREEERGLGCLIQVALNTEKCSHTSFDVETSKTICWYDSNRNKIVTLESEEFLNLLEFVGIA